MSDDFEGMMNSARKGAKLGPMNKGQMLKMLEERLKESDLDDKEREEIKKKMAKLREQMMGAK